MQPPAPLGAVRRLGEPDALEHAARGRGIDRAREHVALGVPVDVADDLLAGDERAPHRAERLAEGDDEEIDLVEDALRLGDAPPPLAGDQDRVRFVDEQLRVVPAARAGDLRQPREVAVGAEDALGADEDARAPALRGDAGEDPLQILDVVVLEVPDGGPGELRALEERGVRGAIEHHVVALVHEGRDGARVHRVARREERRAAPREAQELDQRPLELLVEEQRAADHGRAAAPRP